MYKRLYYCNDYFLNVTSVSLGIFKHSRVNAPELLHCAHISFLLHAA